jgi:hypothetical protein
MTIGIARWHLPLYQMSFYLLVAERVCGFRRRTKITCGIIPISLTVAREITTYSYDFRFYLLV